MRILSAIWTARLPSVAFVMVGLFWGSFAASVPAIRENLGVSDGVFGFLLLGNATGLVMAMFAAPRVDRLLKDRGLQVCAALFSCMIFLPGMAQSAMAFFLIMIVMGMFSGLTDVLMNARLSELEVRSGRSLMNAGHGMFSVGYAVAAFATGLVRDAGYGPAVAMGLAGLVCLILSSRLRTAPEVVEAEAGSSERMPWLILLVCGGIVLVAFMTEATVETWSALHIERTLNGDPLAGALGPTMLGLTMAFGRLGGQGLTDYLPDQLVVVVASLLASAGALVAAAAPTAMVAYIGFALLGLGVSVIGPLGLSLLGQRVAPRFRTEAISKAAVMGFTGFFFAPVLMGLMSEAYGLRMAYAGVAVLAVLAIPLLVVLNRISPPKPDTQSKSTSSIPVSDTRS